MDRKYVVAATLGILMLVSEPSLAQTAAEMVPLGAPVEPMCQLANPSLAPATSEIVTKLRDTVKDANGTVIKEGWIIQAPEVRQPKTSYPGIPLRAGDKVTIKACGCVQTGGKGLTWKDYLFPQEDDGSNSVLYHGRVFFPTKDSTTTNFLGDLILRSKNTYPIPDGVPNSALTLGYDDDQYDDNGYSNHDDGNRNQCVGLGPVVVMVEVERRH